MTETPRDLISIAQAAQILRRHVATVYRWILSGKLRAWTVAGTRHAVSEADVLDLIQARRPNQPPPESRGQQERRYRAACRQLRALGYEV